MNQPLLSTAQERFINGCRVARLATIDSSGFPHVVPICFALDQLSVYVTIDEKPKSETTRELKRLRNIRNNSKVAVTVDCYADDWQRLGWVMLRGHGEVLAGGEQHSTAQALLKDRYWQYREMQLETLPVIAISITRVSSWGNLNSPVAGTILK